MHRRFSKPLVVLGLVLALGVLRPGAARSAPPDSARLEGRVFALDGAPLAGAEIFVDGSLRSRSDQSGGFQIEVTPGEHWVEIRREGYRPLAQSAAGGDEPLELRLEPAARFDETLVVSALRARAGAPFALSELSPEVIERSDYGQELPFLLERTPAVASYSETGLRAGGGYSYFTLRGLPQARINMTFDGVPLNDPEESAVYFSNFGDFTGALSSIQVQRGVGTSSVGAASYGGAIHFESARIEDDLSLEVDLGGGAYGTGRASAAWQSGRTGSGFAVYARAAYQQTDGWREHSGLEQRSLYFGADWRGDRTYVRLFGISGREQSSLAFYAAEPEILAENPRFNPMQPEETDDFGQDLLYLLVARELSPRSELAAQIYYSGAQGSLELFDDPTAKAGLTEYGIDGKAIGALLTARAHGERWRLDAGLHGSRFARDHFAFAESGERRYANAGAKDEVSLFTKIDLDLSPRWRLFGDLQLRRAEFRYRGSVGLEPVDWSFFNPRSGIRFDAGAGISLRASIGRSGREPARNDLLQGQDDIAVPIDLKRVRPERVTDLEVGADWHGDRFDLSAGLYAMEFEDEIATTGELSDFGYPIRRNLPESSRRGFELELELRPAIGWRLVTAANIARNRIETWRQALDVYGPDGEYAGSEIVTVRDSEPALSPATILGQSVEWQPCAGLWLEVAGRYVSSSQLDNLGDRRLATPSYTWLDLAVRWELSRWIHGGNPHLSLRINNLLDENRAWASGYSYPYLVRDASGTDRREGIPYYYPQAPRHIVAGLELAF